MGCHLALEYASTIDHVVAEIGQRFHGTKLLVAGDLNANMDTPKGNNWDEDVPESLLMTVLKDMLVQLLSCHKTSDKDERTKSITHLRREVRSWT